MEKGDERYGKNRPHTSENVLSRDTNRDVTVIKVHSQPLIDEDNGEESFVLQPIL